MEIDEIRNNTEFLHISYNNDDKALHFVSNLSPKTIDDNFNELEARINELDEKLKNIDTKINKMMFNYTSLN